MSFYSTAISDTVCVSCFHASSNLWCSLCCSLFRSWNLWLAYNERLQKVPCLVCLSYHWDKWSRERIRGSVDKPHLVSQCGPCILIFCKRCLLKTVENCGYLPSLIPSKQHSRNVLKRKHGIAQGIILHQLESVFQLFDLVPLYDQFRSVAAYTEACFCQPLKWLRSSDALLLVYPFMYLQRCIAFSRSYN